MSLFKKMSDPSPGGGDKGAGPDPREQVRSAMSSRDDAPEVGGKIVDPTALIMGGVHASGRIDAIRRAAAEINLQDTFDVQLTVITDEGEEFTAHVIQPAAEEYLAAAVEGQALKVKYSAEDQSLVWIDWAGSAKL